MEQKLTTVYVALDGRQFNTEAECLSYEEDVLRYERIEQAERYIIDNALEWDCEDYSMPAFLGWGCAPMYYVKATSEMVEALKVLCPDDEQLIPDGTVWGVVIEDEWIVKLKDAVEDMRAAVNYYENLAKENK